MGQDGISQTGRESDRSGEGAAGEAGIPAGSDTALLSGVHAEPLFRE